MFVPCYVPLLAVPLLISIVHCRLTDGHSLKAQSWPVGRSRACRVSGMCRARRSVFIVAEFETVVDTGGIIRSPHTFWGDHKMIIYNRGNVRFSRFIGVGT